MRKPRSCDRLHPHLKRLIPRGRCHPTQHHIEPQTGVGLRLEMSLAPFGIKGHQIPTTFNVFMDVSVAPSGELTIGPPRSRPGDFVDLRAEMDLVVGVTACSAELSNNGSFKPIDVEVYG